MDLLTLTSTGWNPNYLPLNVAEKHAVFADHGIELVRRPQDPWEKVLTDLDSGAADIALGGMWVPAMYHGTGRDLVVIGQLNGCYAQALVARDLPAPFAWPDLGGRTVLVPGKGSTGGFTFLTGLMREQGLNPTQSRFVRDLSTPMFTELFVGGLADYLLVDLTTAFDLEQRGLARIAVLLADVGGLLPNSVFYARRDRIDELLPRASAFLAGVQDAMDRLGRADARALAEWAVELFPKLPPAAVRAHVEHVRTTLTWKSVRVDPGAYVRWIDFQYAVPLLKRPLAWGDLMDTRAVDGVR